MPVPDPVIPPVFSDGPISLGLIAAWAWSFFTQVFWPFVVLAGGLVMLRGLVTGAVQNMIGRGD